MTRHWARRQQAETSDDPDAPLVVTESDVCTIHLVTGVDIQNGIGCQVALMHQLGSLSFLFRCPMTFVGIPPTIAYAGISFVITAPEEW